MGRERSSSSPSPGQGREGSRGHFHWCWKGKQVWWAKKGKDGGEGAGCATARRPGRAAGQGREELDVATARGCVCVEEGGGREYRQREEGRSEHTVPGRDSDLYLGPTVASEVFQPGGTWLL